MRGMRPVEKMSDPVHWPLTHPTTVWSVLAVYLLFAGTARRIFTGPPVRLPVVTLAYNFVQIVLCSYISVEAAVRARRAGYTLVCNAIVHDAPVMADLLWVFYLSKLLDCCDTVFIVLGKRWNQLSFLHVYHHSSVFLFYWVNMRYNFDGDVYVTMVLNGGVHVLMYTYYAVAMHSRDIWWKRLLTKAQLVQFVLMFLHAGVLLAGGSSCSNIPPAISGAYLMYVASMFALFGSFFRKTYDRRAVVAPSETAKHL